MGNNRRNHLKNSARQKITRLSIIFFTILFLVLSGFFLSTFQVKTIICTHNNHPCSQAILDRVDHLRDSSLFFTDFATTLSQFSSYEIQKKVPQTLIITVHNEPINYYQTTETGEVSPTNQETLDPELNQKINLLFLALTEASIPYTSFFIEDDVIIITLDNGIRALVEINSIQNGIYKLDHILRNLNLKEIDTAIVEIDTRFTMPVLKTRQTDL